MAKRSGDHVIVIEVSKLQWFFFQRTTSKCHCFSNFLFFFIFTDCFYWLCYFLFLFSFFLFLYKGIWNISSYICYRLLFYFQYICVCILPVLKWCILYFTSFTPFFFFCYFAHCQGWFSRVLFSDLYSLMLSLHFVYKILLSFHHNENIVFM